MQWETFDREGVKGVSRLCMDEEHEFVMYKDGESEGKYMLAMKLKGDEDSTSWIKSEPSESPEEAYDGLFVGTPNKLCEYFDDFFCANREADKQEMLDALATM